MFNKCCSMNLKIWNENFIDPEHANFENKKEYRQLVLAVWSDFQTFSNVYNQLNCLFSSKIKVLSEEWGLRAKSETKWWSYWSRKELILNRLLSER